MAGVVKFSWSNCDRCSRLDIPPQNLRWAYDVQHRFPCRSGGNRESASRFNGFGNFESCSIRSVHADATSRR